MLETLLKILAIDYPAPEIFLEHNGAICLDWNGIAISIDRQGGVTWVVMDPKEYGDDLDKILAILEERSNEAFANPNP